MRRYYIILFHRSGLEIYFLVYRFVLDGRTCDARPYVSTAGSTYTYNEAPKSQVGVDSRTVILTPAQTPEEFCVSVINVEEKLPRLFVRDLFGCLHPIQCN